VVIRPVRQWLSIDRVVGLLLLVALEGHTQRIESLAGSTVTHWAVVPSLPAKPWVHPLRGLVAGRAKGSEVPLVAAPSVSQPRTVNADHFTCNVRMPQESHVLLIDDTWTTGGHAQSAALALRKAGAARVSALVVARWLKENYGDNKRFIADLATRDYDPSICPWTSGRCPR
jgi:phosphoribosylpyrophosphate synthetase